MLTPSETQTTIPNKIINFIYDNLTTPYTTPTNSTAPDPAIAKKEQIQKDYSQSVFNIVKLSKNEFLKKSGVNFESIKIAEKFYDTICGASYHIIREYYNTLKSIPAIGIDMNSQNTNSSLDYFYFFEDEWSNLCDPSFIGSINSPAAYICYLYALAKDLEIQTTNAILIDERQKTLSDLLVSEENIYKIIPQIDIVNEILLNFLSDPDKNIENLLAEPKGINVNLPFHLEYKKISEELEENKTSWFEVQSLFFKIKNISRYCLVGRITEKPSTDLERLFETFEGIMKYSQRESPEYSMNSNLNPGLQMMLIDNPDFEQPTNLKDLTKALGINDTEMDSIINYKKFKLSKQVKNASGSSSSPYFEFLNPLTKKTSIWVAYGRTTTFNDLSSDSALNLSFTGTLSKNVCTAIAHMAKVNHKLKISYPELDLLICSVKMLNLKKQASQTGIWKIDSSTILAISLFRYLQQNYNVTPKMYSAFFWGLDVLETDISISFFDEIFNKDMVYLTIDPGIYFTDEKPRKGICKGLNISMDTFIQLSKYVQEAFNRKNLTCTMETISAFYRLVTIPMIFGIKDEKELLNFYTAAKNLVSIQEFTNITTTIAKPWSLNASEYVDILMELDFFIKFFIENKFSFKELNLYTSDIFFDTEENYKKIINNFKNEFKLNKDSNFHISESNINKVNKFNLQKINPNISSWKQILTEVNLFIVSNEPNLYKISTQYEEIIDSLYLDPKISNQLKEYLKNGLHNIVSNDELDTILKNLLPVKIPEHFKSVNMFNYLININCIDKNTEFIDPHWEENIKDQEPYMKEILKNILSPYKVITEKNISSYFSRCFNISESILFYILVIYSNQENSNTRNMSQLYKKGIKELARCISEHDYEPLNFIFKFVSLIKKLNISEYGLKFLLSLGCIHYLHRTKDVALSTIFNFFLYTEILKTLKLKEEDFTHKIRESFPASANGQVGLNTKIKGFDFLLKDILHSPFVTNNTGYTALYMEKFTKDFVDYLWGQFNLFFNEGNPNIGDNQGFISIIWIFVKMNEMCKKTDSSLDRMFELMFSNKNQFHFVPPVQSS